VGKLLDRKPARLVTVAMANKTARIVWAVLTRGEPIAHRSQPNTNRCPQRGRRRTVWVPMAMMMTI
jgi:hypothetical protein